MTSTTTPSWHADGDAEQHPASNSWTPRPWAMPQASAPAHRLPGLLGEAQHAAADHAFDQGYAPPRPAAWTAPSHVAAPTHGWADQDHVVAHRMPAAMPQAMHAQAHAALIPLHAAPTMAPAMVPAAAHPMGAHHFPISRIVPPLSQRDGVFGLLIGLVVLAFPVAGAVAMGVMRDAPKPAATTPIATTTTPMTPATGAAAGTTGTGTAADPAATPGGAAMPGPGGTGAAAGTPGAGAAGAGAGTAATGAGTNTAPGAAAGGATTPTTPGAGKPAAPAARPGAPARPGGATTPAGGAKPTVGGGAHATTPTHAAPVRKTPPPATHAHVHPGGGGIVVTPTASVPTTPAPQAAAAPAPQVAETAAAPTSWSISTPGGAHYDVHSQAEVDQIRAGIPNATITPH